MIAPDNMCARSVSYEIGSAPVHRCRWCPELLAKESLLTLDALVEEVLPDGRFRVALENGRRIVVYTAGKLRKYRVRTVAGDRVQIEMSPYDMEKGRLVYRERVVNSGPIRSGVKRR